MLTRTKLPRPSALLYDRSLVALYDQLDHAHLVSGPDLALAWDLVKAAKQFDITRTSETLRSRFNARVERHLHAPEFYTDPSIIGQVWADHPLQPLGPHEVWNQGRRASNTGIPYQLDDQGLPINPFFNYGVKGRGYIGRYGPNHAVDIAPVRVMENGNGIPALHVLGVIRRDNNAPAICGGFIEFARDPHGRYPYTRESVIDAQTHEFFEEMISGSIPLMKTYARAAEQEINQKIDHRTAIEGSLNKAQIDMICHQIITQHKWLQVGQEDPAFLRNLRQAFTRGRDCYGGPVLSSQRNTNSAWMETRLSWLPFAGDDWDQIKGKKFNYAFVAGDDATSALWHEITPPLIAQARDHAPFFSYILAAYLATKAPEDSDQTRFIRGQAERLTIALSQPLPPWA